MTPDTFRALVLTIALASCAPDDEEVVRWTIECRDDPDGPWMEVHPHADRHMRYHRYLHEAQECVDNLEDRDDEAGRDREYRTRIRRFSAAQWERMP
jgi:hypothetical protein